ncbi:MAG: TM1802 family CRISPR-associated protein, partial [Clostridiales bacterium]|nr:TM1802 family CRISPR-associated protein [Clostridiales bacterium]
MDLPRLMVSAAQGEDGSLLDQKIKVLPFTDKEKNKKRYNVFLILDPDQKEIRFEPKAWQDGDENRYYYLGNNQGNSKQIYAVRDVKSFLNYWTGKGGGVLQALFDFLDEGELKEQLLLCRQKKLFSEAGLSMRHIAGWNPNVIIQDKTFKNNGNSVGAEKLLMELMGLDTGCKLVLIIPCVRQQVISNHKEYTSKIEKILQGDAPAETKQKKKQTLVCHICGKQSETVDTIAYTTKLPRKSVSKVFVTTTVNYASDFESNNHQ